MDSCNELHVLNYIDNKGHGVQNYAEILEGSDGENTGIIKRNRKESRVGFKRWWGI